MIPGSAFLLESGATATITDSTLVLGSGGDYYTSLSPVSTFGAGTVYNGADHSVYKAPVYTSPAENKPVVIGSGYPAHKPVSNIIKDTDGSPASADTPVTVAATIPVPIYTVTIPKTVNFGAVSGVLEKYRDETNDRAGDLVKAKTAFTVSAAGVDNLFDGKTLSVKIGTAGTKTAITGDGNTIDCNLYKNGTAYTEGDEFANFVNDVDLTEGAKNEQTGAVELNRADITKTANYTGTLTFTIAIKEAE